MLHPIIIKRGEWQIWCQLWKPASPLIIAIFPLWWHQQGKMGMKWRKQLIGEFDAAHPWSFLYYTILFFFFLLLKLPVTKLCHQFPIIMESLKRMIGDNDNDVAGIPNCPTPNVPPLTQLSSLLHTTFTFTFTCLFNIFDQQGLDREGDGAKGRMKILHKTQFCNWTGKRLLLSELVTLTTVQSYKTFI